MTFLKSSGSYGLPVFRQSATVLGVLKLRRMKPYFRRHQDNQHIDMKIKNYVFCLIFKITACSTNKTLNGTGNIKGDKCIVNRNYTGAVQHIFTAYISSISVV